MTQDEIWLRSLAQKNDLSITDIQLYKLSTYVKLLKGWNRSINLISRKDEENIWSNHILLSLSLLFKIDFLGGLNILDLGTGGGLPGIPLSILCADINFVLVDSIQKKVKAVEEMIASLTLTNVSVVCARAEDLNKLPKYRNKFDSVIARSVSDLENLVSWGLPFLKKTASEKGLTVTPQTKTALNAPSIIAMKGGETGAEIERTIRRFPNIRIHSTGLVFKGSEILHNAEKKLIFVENKWG